VRGRKHLSWRIPWKELTSITENKTNLKILIVRFSNNHLCGTVVKVPGYRSRGPSFDFQRYQIFWEVAGLKRGPFSLVSTIEELRGRNNSGCGLEIPKYGRKDPSRWLRGTLYPQKLVLTSPTSGGRSVGIVHSRTKTTEFRFLRSSNTFTGQSLKRFEPKTSRIFREITGFHSLLQTAL
jgi:hypothetical protein